MYFFRNIIYRFVFTGSWFHFWFFPALIFAVCFSTILFKINCGRLLIPLSIIAYTIGCIGCSYYELGINMPVLKDLFALENFDLIRRILLMGFPFFASGYLVYKIEKKSKKIIVNKYLLCIWLTAVLHIMRTLYI